jgi:uncharacterized membrane protein
MSTPESPLLQSIENKNKYVLIATAAFVSLFVLCVAWEWFIAPLRPGGSWMALKGLPLLLAIPGIWKAKNYTMQWASMLILIYMTEGLVRLFETGANFWMAVLETLLSLIGFIAVLMYLKPLKQEYKRQKKEKELQSAQQSDQQPKP